MTDLPGKADRDALLADLGSALQHQRAARERLEETQREVEALLRRARTSLVRARREAAIARARAARGGPAGAPEEEPGTLDRP